MSSNDSGGTAPPLPRPPFDPALGNPRDVIPSPETLDLISMRQPLPLFTADAILTKYPHLQHTEYPIPVTDSNPGSETEKPSHSAILSVFKPKETRSTSDVQKRPAIYHVHGGGQVMGNRFLLLDPIISYFQKDPSSTSTSKFSDDNNDTLENNIDPIFLSIEYRLAPEHPAPCALNDTFAGLAWTFSNATSLGIDVNKVLVVGVSGGGPLALGAAVLACERQQRPCAQMLLTPMLDERNDSVSAKQFEHEAMWNMGKNSQAWDWVLHGISTSAPNKAPPTSTYTTPSQIPTSSLSLLPPTFLDVGACEIFRDEVVAFASRLWACGVTAELHVWPGAWHGFDLTLPQARISRDAVAVKRAWLRRVLG